ncbi:MAG: AraC family transcriptional regulator ligand-binding domain-containing protein [Oceanococcus sp.]
MRTHISSHWLRFLFNYLEQRGHDSPRVLGMPCPEPAELRRISALQWRRALEAAAEATGDPALGLHLGASMSLRQIGVLGYVASAADTLGEALLRLQQFERLIYQVDPVHLRFDGSNAILEWHTTVDEPGQMVDETAIAALVACTRELLGGQKPANPQYVRFVNPPPDDITPYLAFFGEKVQFNAPTTIVAFDASLLQASLARPDPALLDILERQAALLLEQIPGSDAFESELRRALTQAIARGEPNLATVAASLNCSSRSLQRHLSQRDLNFQKILDDSRHQLAERYLQDVSLPLSEIALLLGYSEQSAFNRSFKRWTGCSPRHRRLALNA